MIRENRNNPQPVNSEEIVDFFTRYSAIVKSVDAKYLDKFTVDIYIADFKLAEDVEAYTLELTKYAAGDNVIVYWRPDADYALILERSIYGYFKVTADWVPNGASLTGKICTADGTLMDTVDTRFLLRENLEIVGAQEALPSYAPFRKNDIVLFIDARGGSPYNAAPIDGFSYPTILVTHKGYVWKPVELPIPTSLKQVLVVSGGTSQTGGTYRIKWGFIQMHDENDARV